MALPSPMMLEFSGQELLVEEYDENFEPSWDGKLLRAKRCLVVYWLSRRPRWRRPQHGLRLEGNAFSGLSGQLPMEIT